MVLITLCFLDIASVLLPWYCKFQAPLPMVFLQCLGYMASNTAIVFMWCLPYPLNSQQSEVVKYVF